MECSTLEDIARKLEMFHSYEDQIAAVKQQYNNSQMAHVLDEAKEIGEKIAEEAEKTAPKTEEERRELHKWIEAGYSVHENTCCAVGDGNSPIDFLDIYREEEALRKATAGMGNEEARKYVLDYYGWTEEENEQKEYTVEALKERVRELERELFHLEEFIGQKGFWEESQKYIDEYGGEPIPFEIK